MEKHQCQGDKRSWQRHCESNRDHAGTSPGRWLHPHGTLGELYYQPEHVLNGYADIQRVPVKVEVAMNEPMLLGIELVQKLCGVK